MGPEQAAEALRRALAMGGDDAVLVTDPALAGADEWATARVLAAALDKLAPDVALMGMASDDARGSLVPGAVAAMRDVPLLSYGAELALGRWRGPRPPPVAPPASTGSRRRCRSSPRVTDQVGEPRYASLKGIMAAKRKPMETWSLADLGLSADDLRGAALTQRHRCRDRRRRSRRPSGSRTSPPPRPPRRSRTGWPHES